MEAELKVGVPWLFGVLAVTLPAHSETRPRYAGTVEATLLGAPATLDPVFARTHAEITADALIFDTLYRIGPDGVAQPHLAAALPVVDDRHATARIALKKGVKFHDGSVLAAQDVVASLERTRAHAAWILAPFGEIHADGDAIVVALKAPSADVATLFALAQTGISKPAKDIPIGTGAYSPGIWDKRGHKLALKAFDEHFAGRPYVDLILRWYDTPDGEARKFETGAAQLSARGVAAFAGAQAAYKADDVEGPAALLVYVGFGTQHAAITGDHSFRRALDLALPRGGLEMITTGERVVPTRLPVPVEAGGQPIDASARGGDLAAAKAELAEAAKRVADLAPGKIGAVHLEIFVEDTRPDDREIAERVVNALDKLGLAAKITAVSAEDLRTRLQAGQVDLWIGQLAEPVATQTAWWGAAFAAGDDDWALRPLAAGTLDAATAGKAFTARMPIVPLMFRAVRLWHRTDVRGLSFDASGRPCYADLFFFGSAQRTKP
jgi:ABC-type transport system substrate-binding protein